MSFPTIPIFPEGSLADSVVVTVWLGVFVISFFNLRFGWTFSGLVVPGYLVPLLMAKPLAAVVVLVEGVLAYFLVWLAAPVLARMGRWSNLFGRDRFFALVIASVVVRVLCDGFILPAIARAVTEDLALEFDAASNLHSFGLIIVSLIANQFWKPGLRVGIKQLVVCLALTYLLVRYPLMWFTNFNIGNLEYMYEEISSSVLSSPKAYIVLIITSYIASRMNLLYAWDYNGILIPSLLALQWYEPLKILTSIAEAWAIFLLACGVLRLPLLRETSVEGARKVLLFFNLSVAYKLVLGHVIVLIDPTAHTTDWFGFGYLLPTLLAIKMHDKGIALRVTRTTLQTSLTGAVVASAVGFCLTYFPEESPWSRTQAVAEIAPEPLGPRDLVGRLHADKAALYRGRTEGVARSPTKRQLEAFTSAVKLLREHIGEPEPSRLALARRRLAVAGYGLHSLDGGMIYLREIPPARGWGIYVLGANGARGNGLLVEVPSPIREWATLEAGAYLFRISGARALAISTSHDARAEDGPRSSLSRRGTYFHVFHGAFGGRGTVEVRGYTAGSLRVLHSVPIDREPVDGVNLPEFPSGLWVTKAVPSGLSLRLLKGLLRDYTLEWHGTPFSNVQRDSPGEGFVELYLNRPDRKRLLARHLLGVSVLDEELGAPVVRANLRADLLSIKDTIAAKGSGRYWPAEPESLFFLDAEVVTPLVKLALDPTCTDAEDEIRAAHAAATSIDYAVTRLTDTESGNEFLVLGERPDAPLRRHWGTYVFRLGSASRYAIEVPRPLHERNTLEYGTVLFERLGARFLLLSGTHPEANTDGSADLVAFRNKRSLFNLVNQCVLREAGDEPLMAVQIRAFGWTRNRPSPETDAILALGDGSVDRFQLDGLAADLLTTIESDHGCVEVAHGHPHTAGLEVTSSAQSHYLNHTLSGSFAIVWLSPFLRRNYAQHEARSRLNAQREALGIETVETSLAETIFRSRFATLEGWNRSRLIETLEHYLATRDVNTLYMLEHEWPGLRLVEAIDTKSGRPFLLIRRGETLLPLVVNLSFVPYRRQHATVKRPFSKDDVTRFADSSAGLLVIEEDT